MVDFRGNWTTIELECTRMDGDVGKKKLIFCLDYYTNKKSDDIAKAQYRK